MTTQRAAHGNLALARTSPVEFHAPSAMPDRQPAIHPSLRQLSARFERSGIRWCHLDDQPLPGPGGGDLRVLVHPLDLVRAEHAVRATGGIAAPTDRRPHRRIWLLREPDSGATVTVQVTTRLAPRLGEDASLRIVHGVLVNRVDGCVPAMAETERFWLLMLRVLDRRRPAPGGLLLLRSLARRTPVASSPLAEVVTAFLGGYWSVPTLLTVLEHGGHLPRLRRGPLPRMPTRVLRPRRAYTDHTLEGVEPPATPRRLGMTVAVVRPDQDAHQVPTTPPLWPLPVLVVDAGVGVGGRAVTPMKALRGVVRLRTELLRFRVAARSGTLVLLDNPPYRLSAGPTPIGRQERVVLRAMIALLPTPDAVAVLDPPAARKPVDAGTWRGGNPTGRRAASSSPLYPRPACPVLSMPADAYAGSEGDHLAQSLWELLSWRVASNWFAHRSPARRVGRFTRGRRPPGKPHGGATGD